MTAEVAREEYAQLVGRVDVLEREVEGEKLVTRHILAETRRNSDDLAVIKTRLDRLEVKVDGLGTTLHGLVRNLPQIVGDAVSQALSERDKR